MDDFTAKVETRRDRESNVGKFEIGSKIKKGEMLLNMTIINPVF